MKQRALKIPDNIDKEMLKLQGHLGNKSINDIYISAAKEYIKKHGKDVDTNKL